MLYSWKTTRVVGSSLRWVLRRLIHSHGSNTKIHRSIWDPIEWLRLTPFPSPSMTRNNRHSTTVLHLRRCNAVIQIGFIERTMKLPIDPISQTDVTLPSPMTTTSFVLSNHPHEVHRMYNFANKSIYELGSERKNNLRSRRRLEFVLKFSYKNNKKGMTSLSSCLRN